MHRSDERAGGAGMDLPGRFFSTHPIVCSLCHEAVVLHLCLSRQESSHTHRDGSTDELGEARNDDETRRSHTRQACREGKGHGEAIAESDDDVSHHVWVQEGARVAVLELAAADASTKGSISVAGGDGGSRC